MSDDIDELLETLDGIAGWHDYVLPLSNSELRAAVIAFRDKAIERERYSERAVNLIPGQYNGLLDNNLNDMLIEQVEKIVQTRCDTERIRLIAIVRSHYHSFDDDYYVCLPPQDVISDILASLEEAK